MIIVLHFEIDYFQNLKARLEKWEMAERGGPRIRYVLDSHHQCITLTFAYWEILHAFFLSSADFF